MNKIIIKIILIILFVCCLLQMPYGYYQLVRFIGMTSFVWLAYQTNKKKDQTFLVVWIASAVLINPFIKLTLGRTIWNIVDVILAVILLISIWKDIASLNKQKAANPRLS